MALHPTDHTVEASNIAFQTRLRRINSHGSGKHLTRGTCALCGADFAFSPGKHGQRFCSSYCRRKAWAQNHYSLDGLIQLRRRIAELEAMLKEHLSHHT